MSGYVRFDKATLIGTKNNPIIQALIDFIIQTLHKTLDDVSLVQVNTAPGDNGFTITFSDTSKIAGEFASQHDVYSVSEYHTVTDG